MKKPKLRNITVFFCWQSDIRGQREMILRELVNQKFKLEDELNCKIDIEEDKRRAPGMISISDEVFKKIEQADVIICDITPVSFLKLKRQIDGVTLPRQKAMPNSNVMLELGYALRCMHPSRIIALANAGYGKWSDGQLPFDIFHRGYVKFTSKRDLDIAHELGKSINFVKEHGRVEPNGSVVNKFISWLNRKIIKFSTNYKVESMPLKEEANYYFNSKLALAFPGIHCGNYDGEVAINKLKVFFERYLEDKNAPKLYLSDNYHFYPANHFEILNDTEILIGDDILKIKNIDVHRSDIPDGESKIVLHIKASDKAEYSNDFEDNQESVSGDIQEYAIYNDNNGKTYNLTKQHYEDKAVYRKDGDWICLRGNIKLRRIHLKSSSLKLVSNIGSF